MRKFALALALLVFAGAACAYNAWRWLDAAAQLPGPLAVETPVLIAPGTGTPAIAAKMAEAGAVNSELVFLLRARIEGRLAPLKAGEYLLTPGISAAGIVSLLQSGKTYQRHITISEGLTSAEIVALLKAESALSGEIAKTPDDGTLLPETYYFSHGDTRQGVLDRMKAAMKDARAELWPLRDPTLRLAEDEAVTLASIVEKETGVATERPRVAGVFYNRMRKGMPLQSDPTVIYALTHGQAPLGRALTRDDLRKPSPYNTYLASGLPPSPIANPGRASLEAVLHPEKNDYLYFVADGSGGHAFSKTLQEHNKAVARWRALK